MSTRKLVVGNWKMNPASQVEAQNIIKMYRKAAPTLDNTDVVACPSFIFIPECISKKDSVVAVGSQTVSMYDNGAHTGEVSAAMLKDMGVEYAIVGHSETRAAGDTDENISRRTLAALTAGLKAIVCVGETTRDEGGVYLQTLKQQITASLAGIPKNMVKNIVIAYEPVWAIGAKAAMESSQIYEMSLFVKKSFSEVFGHDPAMKVPVLYGGSVNATNAADIISVGKVDGLLVGRESVNVTGFPDLLRAVDSAK